MTGEGEKALLAEYLATCARLHSGFANTAGHVERLMPMTVDAIDVLPIDDETRILAFLKRFEQLEDALNRTLKAISQIMEYGKIERLTARDVTRRAYVLGILDSDKVWADAVRTRNALAHEYPLNPGKRVEQVNAAWASRQTLDITWAAIQRFVEVEGLLG